MRKKLLIGIAICVVVSLILVVSRNTALSLFFQGITQKVYLAPKAALYNFTVSAHSKNELDLLRQENAHLHAQLVEIDHLRKDNEALKSQFEEGHIDSDTLLPALIVGYQGSIANPQVLVIDRGAQDDIQEGQAVIVGKNLIGIIGHVSERYSSVTVITNQSFSTVAKTSRQDTLGVIQGEGDFLLFDRVAITQELEKGDTVLTRGSVSEQAVGIPPDLIVGKVESVRKVDSEPFQSAQVKSLVDIGKLTQVFIIL